MLFFFVLSAGVASLWLVVSQINRDELLSRVGHTRPGRTSWTGSHLLNLITFVALPLLTILATEFPGLQRILFAWVAPLVRALTHV